MTTEDSARLPKGLTAAQVEESRRAHGANVLTPPERDPWWRLYLEKFNDSIIRILLVAAVIALLVGIQHGDFIEGIGILAAVFLSTGISFFNEYRAAKEFDILNSVSDDEEVAVIRDGGHRLVPRKDLVVGDIVQIEQGAEVPADGRVLHAVGLSLNESSLTGESAPVPKRPEDGPADSGLAYPRNIALRGTTVADGHGRIELIRVGDATEIGQTARAAAETPDAMTPLAKQLERLAGLLSIGAFVAASVIFAAQTVRGALNGEIYVLNEAGGKLIRQPLEPGQWFCFILLIAVALILGAQIWTPTLKHAFKLIGRENLFPRWPDQSGGKSFLRLAAIAAAVAVIGILSGLATGLLSLRHGEWLPLSALSAFLSYFMVAVTVIVVAVPEGLPMCVALALAYSMRKMMASNNLVRKMHACETIGAASVICSDKTGTLTMNEMRVHRPVFPFLPDGPLPADGIEAGRLAEAASANSTANLLEKDGKAEPLGNPTEAAILLWLNASGREYGAVRAAFGMRHQLTFSTERKFMATSGVGAVDGKPVLYAKGAPEIIIKFCAEMRGADGSAAPMDQADRDRILRDVAEYQNRGMRILGFASRHVDEAYLEKPIDPALPDMIWDGFFAIADPVRPDVADAVNSALSAGVGVKIVTGDNQATAREIARQIGLWKETDTDDNIVTGDAFESMTDEDASRAAERLKVMSRARPLHKLRLVKLLQQRGGVVAVTGDGTNDAPALNHADVGLAMGKTGTAVAREAADIILLDDSFTSIVNAVAWGRSLYANIQKFVVFQLTINVAAVGIALLGPFLGVTLPLTVVQMLWVNLIMDTFAALALASEPADWDLMKNPPRRAGEGIITRPMRNRILGVGLAFLALFLVTLAFGERFPLDPSVPAGRHNLTIFFTAFVFLQFWNLWNARVFGSNHSAFHSLSQSKGFLLMAAIIVAGQILLVEFGGAMFRVTPLSAAEWLAIILFTSPVLWIGELWRLLGRMRRGQAHSGKRHAKSQGNVAGDRRKTP
ncbi:MAG: calcium-translocating P-type ATPase, PMCA-type [Planctomycetota bacterium]|jgi:Ca2+-transporting ATPase|nr:calcium-translocating P-type ATPase, PMCA-type [Planctomycetota bacterium]